MGIHSPYLTLMREDVSQREYPLREVFNGPRYVVRGGISWRMIPNDLPPWEIVYQQTRRWLKAGVFEAMVHDLRALHVTAADEQDHAQVAQLAQDVQDVTGQTVEVAFVDQGYTGDQAAQAAAAYGLRLEVVKLSDAKRGFVLLPRRWVVERSFGWMSVFVASTGTMNGSRKL